MISSATQRHPARAKAAMPKGELLTRVGVAVLFFILASFAIKHIITIRIATLDPLGWARLISTASLVSFFLMIVWLTLVRPSPLARAPGRLARIAAVAGTWLFSLGVPFLTRRTDLGVTMLMVSSSLILAGDILAVLILRKLGRSFSIMAEARKLVTHGPYSVIRHPLYAAELLATLGVLIQFASVEAALLVAVQFAFQLIRMRKEEAVLMHTFPEYAEYMMRTRRLVPGLW